jgi:hypothetical protein
MPAVGKRSGRPVITMLVNAIVANITGPYQPADGRTPALAVKILEE